MTDSASKAPDTESLPSLLKMGGYLRKGQVSDDARRLFLTGGRDADVFYRERWKHDKVVRSTHGVNCTGSCSWEVMIPSETITSHEHEPVQLTPCVERTTLSCFQRSR